MAFIQQIAESDAEGAVDRLYSSSRARAGGVANIIRVMSQDGASAAQAMQFYVSLMKSKNALNAAQREMLATVVSNVNDCFY